jgi:hypothetical protein
MKRTLKWIVAATIATLASQTLQAQDPPPLPPTPVDTWYPTAVKHSSDRVPPSPPQIACVLVWRGWGEHGAASEQSCLAHRGFIQFSVKPGADNVTPMNKLGYRFEYVDGAMPAGLTIFPTGYSLSPTAELYLVWDDGATWQQEEFCFRIALRAIDQAGNESARSNVLIIGHDGDMEYTHRKVDGMYSRLAYEQAANAARAYFRDTAATSTDTVLVEAASASLKPPSVIRDVYDAVTIRGIESMRVARIDRIAFHSSKETGDMAFELEPYSLAETGRELTKDEVLQLRDLLLDPRSYIPDHWSCGFNAEYAVTAGPGNEKTYIVAGKDCYGVSISGPGFQHGGELTREAASLLRAYFAGLFTFEKLK